MLPTRKAAISALLIVSLSSACDLAAERELAVERACTAALSRLWPQWSFPSISSEVSEWAERENERPTVTFGDFDGDGRTDVALLVQPFPESTSPMIAACLSGSGLDKPVVITDPYCYDGLTRQRRGQPYYDFATGLEGVYPSDGIHAYCFEKAGATYIIKGGRFEPIVDSD